MKKFFLILLSVIALTSCGNAQKKQASVKDVTPAVQVIYFHGAQRCITCRTIEALTKEVVSNDFAKEVAGKKLVMKVVDFSTPEGEKVADHYQVAFSSLVIDDHGKVTDLTDMGFGYAKSQPEVFKTKLREAITQALK
jgi:hypothetical protein